MRRPMAERPVIERGEFERLVRDALASLYDHAALQIHPLAAYLGQGGADRGTRGEQLREALIAAIERLRPPGREGGVGSSEWRPYVLLHSRYLDGDSLPDLQARLALSERQARREHSRAVEAIAALLWDQAFPGQTPLDAASPPARATAAGGDANDFLPAPGPLDLVELLDGLAAMLRRRVESEGATLEVIAGDALPHVLADRVILRQVLLSLIGYALESVGAGRVIVSVGAQGSRVGVGIRFHADAAAVCRVGDGQKTLANAHLWAQRIQADLEIGSPPDQAGAQSLVLHLPRADQPLILVVDDQEMALRLYQRYLSQTGVRLMGIRDGSQVLEHARRLRPQAVILDVMMPNMDGWEVLQALQADPATRDIPVIVCSVWEEPELAFSLGAADFLRKPTTQREFLAPLARLRLLETWAEPPAAGR